MRNPDKAPIFVKSRTPPQIHPANTNQVEILNLDDQSKNDNNKNKKLNVQLKGSKRITINARGTKFDVYANLFDKAPNSRLGKLKAALENNNKNSGDMLDDICDEFDQRSNEFYFNKDPYVLNMVINYLTIDKMHYGDGVCPYLIAEELEYWGLDEYSFDECCNDRYFSCKNSIEDRVSKEKEIIKNYLYRDDFGKWLFPDIRAKIWDILEYPEKSWVAQVTFF